MRRVAALVAVLAVLAAGCGGDAGDDASSDTAATTAAHSPTTAAPTTTSTTVAPTTTTLSAEEEVLAAYRHSYSQLLAAYDPPDPNHEGLHATHTGPLLERYVIALATRAGNGTAYRADVSSDPRIESIDGSRASVIDCIHEVGVDVDLASGRLFSPVDERQAIRSTMVRDGGAWTRSDLAELEACP